MGVPILLLPLLLRSQSGREGGVDRARRRRVTQIAMRVGWGNHPTRDRESRAFTHLPQAAVPINAY